MRRYRDGFEAVRGIDLAIAPGEIFGFLGPNGAGKTTTVRMLATLLPISAGTARVAGIDVARQPAAVRRRIGVALQEIGLDANQSGRELLTLQCGLYGVPARRVAARAAELLDLVGLTEAGDRLVRTYSGGMRRRLDLASALVHAPEVLFLDEPTTGLDPASRLTVWEEVRRVNAGGTTVFLTTQYLEEADQLAGRVAIIDRGVLVAGGTPDELKSALGSDVVSLVLDPAAGGGRSSTGDRPDLATSVSAVAGVDHMVVTADGAAVYVGDGAAAVPALVRAAEASGHRVRAVSVARPTLDDVFLAATGRRLDIGAA